MGVISVRKGQGASLVGVMVGLMVAVIIGVGVAIPVVQNVTASASITGLTSTIVTYISPILAAVIIAAAAGIITRFA
jgi:Tfp pilus assembly major pilin PilA